MIQIVMRLQARLYHPSKSGSYSPFSAAIVLHATSPLNSQPVSSLKLFTLVTNSISSDSQIPTLTLVPLNLSKVVVQKALEFDLVIEPVGP